MLRRRIASTYQPAVTCRRTTRRFVGDALKLFEPYYVI